MTDIWLLAAKRKIKIADAYSNMDKFVSLSNFFYYLFLDAFKK